MQFEPTILDWRKEIARPVPATADESTNQRVRRYWFEAWSRRADLRLSESPPQEPVRVEWALSRNPGQRMFAYHPVLIAQPKPLDWEKPQPLPPAAAPR
jgi:hypothetical protein